MRGASGPRGLKGEGKEEDAGWAVWAGLGRVSCWVAEKWFGSSNSLPLFYFLFPISNTTQT